MYFTFFFSIEKGFIFKGNLLLNGFAIKAVIAEVTLDIQKCERWKVN